MSNMSIQGVLSEFTPSDTSRVNTDNHIVFFFILFKFLFTLPQRYRLSGNLDGR